MGTVFRRVTGCLRCGRRLPAPDLCGDCKYGEHALERVVFLGYYREPWSLAIRRMKFGRRPGLCREFVRAAMEFPMVQELLSEVDFVTFVPMTRVEEERRGFNQAYLLARELAVRAEKPLFLGVRKIRETLPQAMLSGAKRRENLRGAFAVKYSGLPRIRGRTALLVDDIYTTGTTMERVSRELLRAGVARVLGFALARAGV